MEKTHLNSTWKSQLRFALMEYFNETELKGICFDLDIDYETVSKGLKTDTVMELIEMCQRTSQINHLIDTCKRQRPNVSWVEIANAAAQDKLKKKKIISSLQSNKANFTNDQSTKHRRKSLPWLLVGFALLLIYAFINDLLPLEATQIILPINEQTTTHETNIPTTPKTPPPLGELNILVKDQFDSNAYGWPIIQNVSFVGNGRYQTTVSQEYWHYPLMLPNNQFQDVLLSVDAIITSSDGNGGFAFHFRGQDNGAIYYFATVTIYGEVIIGYRNDIQGEVQDILWEKIKGLTLTEGASYNFAVINKSDLIEVYLDGEFLASIEDTQLVNSGSIALVPFNWNGSHTNVDFDNLIIAEFK